MEDLVQKITELFIAKILKGEWVVNEWLPTERELSEEFHVGRPTIHSVMIRLQEVGLVQIVPRHGVKLLDLLESGKIGTMEIIIELYRNEIPEEIKRSMFHFIGDNLTSIVDNCLKLGLRSKLTMQSPSEEEMHELLGDRQQFAAFVFRFYKDLSSLGGNLMYSMFLNSMKNGILNAACCARDRKKILSRLMELMEALARFDGEKAHQLNQQILVEIYQDWK